MADERKQIAFVEGGYQDCFFKSEDRFPCLIAGIGTGKTFIMLYKIWSYCELYPNSIWLIVRKEFTDLRDSTMKDFTRYFGVSADSNKEYKFKNGSVIMFRHADETAVLKNINLSGFAFEQAEEFETSEQFVFLRDRLRNQAGPYRQGLIISNACGRNWIWDIWINLSACVMVTNETTGEFTYVCDKSISKTEDAVLEEDRKVTFPYVCYTANTYANAHNLPQDFLDDLDRMAKDAPNHFQQYVMNSFDEVDLDDALLTHDVVYGSSKLDMEAVGSIKRIMAVDVARMGGDEITFTVLETRGPIRLQEVFKDVKRFQKIPETVGQTLELAQEWDIDIIVVDDTGMGGGVTDLLDDSSGRFRVIAFNGGEKSENPLCGNKRAEAYFKLQNMLDQGWLKIIPDQKTQKELLSIRFKYKGEKKFIVSKEEMRKKGIPSPGRADGLMMAVSEASSLNDQSSKYPGYSPIRDGFGDDFKFNELNPPTSFQ